MKQYGVFVILGLLCSWATLPSASADVIFPDTKGIEHCEKIVNVEAFSDMILIGVTEPVNGDKKMYKQITEGCISKDGYKLNTFQVYAAKKDAVSTTLLDSYDYSNQDLFQALSLTPESSTVYVPNTSTIASEEVQYKLLGYKGGMMMDYVSTKITTYTDGTAQKVETFAAPEIDQLTTVFPVSQRNPCTFKDLAGHFAFPFVADLYAKRIVDCPQHLRFHPDTTLTRAEALKLTMLGFFPAISYQQKYIQLQKDHPEYAYQHFTDVPMTAWYAPYIEDALSLHILASDKTEFHGGDNINRAEFLKIVMRARYDKEMLDIYGPVDLSRPMDENWISTLTPLTDIKQPFKDVALQSWYTTAVIVAVNLHIIDAKDYFYPDRAITRGEAAKILSLAISL